METVIKTLANLGLKKQEIKIYLGSIKYDALSATKLAKETKIDRTNCYDILQKLIEEGIVSTVQKGKAKHFIALKPEDLIFHFKNKFTALETILPKLQSMTKISSEPVTCELFQGKDGLVNAVKDLVLSKQDYKAIGIREEYEEILGYFNKQFLIKIDLSRIKESVIGSDASTQLSEPWRWLGWVSISL